MEQTTINEQILIELKTANAKYDEILTILEEMSNGETSMEITESTQTSLENLDSYQQFTVDSTKVSLSLWLCTLSIVLIWFGSYLSRIIFRRF